MRQRDYNDSNRAASPLKQAPDAVLLDTTHLDFERQRAGAAADHPGKDRPMNESHEKQAVQLSGLFFNLIFTIAMLVSRLLHPVSVEGLEHLPRRGALLIANHASNWDPILLTTALPRDYRLRVMGKEELFRNPILAWIIRVGGAFPREPGRRGHSGGENRHPDYSKTGRTC